MTREIDHVDAEGAIERLRVGRRIGRAAALSLLIFGACCAVASSWIDSDLRWFAFAWATTVAIMGTLGLAVTASPRLLARVHYWSERASLPRDAPSSSRTCAKCGRPLQAATWQSGDLPPVRDHGAVCGRCGGMREPAQRRADIEARHQAVTRWLDEQSEEQASADPSDHRPAVAMRRLIIGWFAIGLVVAGCGSTADDGTPPTEPTTTTATTTSTTTSTTTPTTTSTSTTVAPVPSWPEELGSTELLDAYGIAADWPLVQVRLSQQTSRLLEDGTTGEGEGIDLAEIWEGDHVEGHAEFRGRDTITIARASGNTELAEIMLGDGIDYVVHEPLLYLPRRVATTLHADITRSGTEWVSIELDRLEPTELFVASLLAPFLAARLRPADDEEDAVHVLRFTTGDRASYSFETDTLSQTVELDTDGALRELAVRATTVLAGAPVVQRYEVGFDPFDGDFAAATPSEADDVTQEFREYVAGRATVAQLGPGT
ncbi:MAG: hypothetical protein R2707_08110 [Acidimicrobiales bacterium]